MIIVSDFIPFISTHNDELLEQKSEEKSDFSRIFFQKKIKMQSVKSYLGLRLPGWAELRDGSFLSRALKKTEASPEVSLVKEFEVRR